MSQTGMNGRDFMHAYVILNPVAGQGEPDKIVSLLEKQQEEGRMTFDLYETTGEEDLSQIVQEALGKNYDLMVAAGGDGTVSGVADGLAGNPLPLGIIPAGTVNSLAEALGIPQDNQAAVALLSTDHRVRAIDAIHDGERHFLINASMGITARSMKATDREDKNHLGWWAYLWSGIKKILGLEPIHFSFDFGDHQEKFLAAEVIIFNSDDLGVIDEDIAVDVMMDDGALDLYAVRSRTLPDLLKVLWMTVLNQPRRNPHIRYWQVMEQVRISAQKAISYQGDGDIKGELPAQFSVKKEAIRIIVPETHE
jgi:YegS/Rv2252/BmrU family lipid kinase